MRLSSILEIRDARDKPKGSYGGTAESLFKDILRCSFESGVEMSDPLKTAVPYGISYLYENREQADFKDLAMTLKCLLFGQRDEVF